MALDGATTSPYLFPDRGGFAVAAADVEADAGGIAADVDGSAVEIVAAWVAKAKAKTKSVRSRGGSRLTGSTLGGDDVGGAAFPFDDPVDRVT